MKMENNSSLDVDAITFDDFNTLRYAAEEVDEDIIYPILRSLKSEFVINEGKFLQRYYRIDEDYRRDLRETLRESVLDDLVIRTLVEIGQERKVIEEIVKRAVDEGLATRRTKWFPDTKQTLALLCEKGYKLGLISNTHWRHLAILRNELERYFSVITFSYEHGWVKPHPSIFQVTLNRLGVQANRCLHVGDDPIADIQGARQVGMKVAFVRRGNKRSDAKIQINQVHELLQFFMCKDASARES